MATKIGYVGRDASEQINWAEVGSNFSGILKEEARVREEKKAEIDRATREQMKVLQNVVTGDSANMNTWSLNYGADAQQQLLMANALLKNGQLKPKDYTIMRQNLADGTDQAMTLAQDYQSEFAIKKARAKANPGTAVGPDGKPITGSQELESFLMESAEGFGNFSKSKLVINNQTGNVLVGFMNPTTGEIETDPNKLVGINNLRNRIKGNFDAYDITSAVTKAKAEVFGQFQAIDAKLGSLYQKGLITTMSGAALRTPSNIAAMVKRKLITKEEGELIGLQKDTENLWAESQLSNVYNISSLLTNNLGGFASNGEKYTFTWNADEENENTILLKEVDGTAVPNFDSEIGKAHRETAKEGLKGRLRGALDVGTEGQAVGGVQRQVTRRSDYSKSQDDIRKQLRSDAKLWNALMTADQATFQRAANAFLASASAKNTNLYKFDVQNDKVIFKYKDGSTYSPPGNVSDYSQKDWSNIGVEVLSTSKEGAPTITADEIYSAGGHQNGTVVGRGGAERDISNLGKKPQVEGTPEGDKLFQ